MIVEFIRSGNLIYSLMPTGRYSHGREIFKNRIWINVNKDGEVRDPEMEFVINRILDVLNGTEEPEPIGCQ